MASAVTLGQISVSFTLLKLASVVVVAVIFVVGIGLVLLRPKQKERS